MTKAPFLYRPYGVGIGHKADCRCEECLSATRFNDKMFRYGKRDLYTYEDFKHRAAEMIEAVGGSADEVTAQTGFWSSTLYAYLKGGDKIVPARVAVKFLAIDIASLKRKPKRYPIEHFAWRIGVLAAMGYPKTWIAETSGVHEKRLFPKNYKTIEANAWDAVDVVWQKHKNRMADPDIDGIRPSYIVRAKRFGAKGGYYPFAAYENEFDTHPADTGDVVGLLRDDRERLDTAIETRVKANMQHPDIVAELAPLYPDFNITKSIERVRTRLNRTRRKAEQATQKAA